MEAEGRKRRDAAKKRAGWDGILIPTTRNSSMVLLQVRYSKCRFTEPHAGVESSTGSGINTCCSTTIPPYIRSAMYALNWRRHLLMVSRRVYLYCRRRVQGCEEPTCDPPVNPGSMQNSSRAHGEFVVKEQDIAPWDYAV